MATIDSMGQALKRGRKTAFLALFASALTACDGEFTSTDTGGSGGDSSAGGGGAGGMETGGTGGMTTGGTGGMTTGGTGGMATGGSGGADSCGDGVRTTGEVCDGDDLGGASCTSALGVIATGKVMCAAGCGALDISGCAPVSAVDVAVGNFFACALLDDESLECWGGNEQGELGLGDNMNRGDQPGELGGLMQPIDVGTGRHVVSAALGSANVCAVLDNQTLKCWGDNNEGRLGLGDISPRGDNPNEMGDNLPAVDLGTGKSALAVTGGGQFNCALLQDHTVKCWGSNANGQLGLGDTNDRGDQPNEMGDALPAVDLGTGKTAVAVSAGSQHACAILDDGAVKCWGRNDFGQLGIGEVGHRGDQPNEMGDALPAVDLGAGHTALSISAGADHTCAVLDDQTLKCWGYNGAGELGLGDILHRGDNPGEMGDNLPPVDVGTGRTVMATAVGWDHACALLDDASVKCWGAANYGQLGLGDTNARGEAPGEMGDNLPALDLGTGRTALSISTLYDTTCARLDNGAVKCWGKNNGGALGLGDTLARGDGPDEMGDKLPAVRLTATQRVRNGFVQSDGAQTFSNTCDFTPADALDCSPTAYPFSAYPLPPAGITLDPGTFVADRFGAAFWAGATQKVLLGTLQSDGAKEWVQLCDVPKGGAFQCDPGVPPAMQPLPPPGLVLPAGKTIGGRYTFVYRENGVQKLRNGFVQSDGAQSFEQTCDLLDGVLDCDAAAHPFASAPVPGGIAPAMGTYLGDRYTFAYVVAGAQKLRNGFVQSDGGQSFSQTCDIAQDGTASCGASFNPFPLPPQGIPAGTVVNHRYAFTYLQ